MRDVTGTMQYVFAAMGGALGAVMGGFDGFLYAIVVFVVVDYVTGVMVGILDLNIRKGPGIDYARTGSFTGAGVFTVVEEADGAGASKWGLLKSYQKKRDGWIALYFVTRV